MGPASLERASCRQTIKEREGSMTAEEQIASMAAREKSRNTRYLGPMSYLLAHMTKVEINNLGDESVPQPKSGMAGTCYRASFWAAWKNRKLTYVEGFAHMGVGESEYSTKRRLIKHAWLVDEKGKIIDKTWWGINGIATYCGVPIQIHAVDAVREASGYYGVLCRKDQPWSFIEDLIFDYPFERSQREPKAKTRQIPRGVQSKTGNSLSLTARPLQ
jgi:hypothetical protein